MRAGWLHGVFVIWRNGTDKETIYDWGVYQLDDKGQLDAHLINYKPEIICEARVPIFTSRDPQAILQCDIDAAVEVLNADLIAQVRNEVGSRPNSCAVRARGPPAWSHGQTQAARRDR